MGEDWVGVVGAGGAFLFLTVVVRQFAATWRARMMAAREEQYRQLAVKYQALLEDSVEIQRRTVEELTQSRAALTSMERMMREVE